MIPEIEAVLEVYHEFYREERYCGCTKENRYPHNVDSEGKPVVCMAHEWSRQQRLFQKLLVGSDLSLPIPPQARWDDRAERFINSAGDRIYTNPSAASSRIVHPNIEVGDDGSIATGIAWYLSQAEWENKTARRQHIVVYLDRTMVITNTFSGKEARMRDAIMYAPVLVFWNNRDSRNGSWIKNAIRSRPNGLAFVIR